MDLWQAMEARHSVRSYTDQKIEGRVLQELSSLIEDCNRKGGLHIQLCLEEPEAFSGMRARYGKFHNVRNYMALVGKAGKDWEELCGYYGELLVLKAQQLALNTCWVALSYRKGKSRAIVKSGEKLHLVIAIGYGTTQGSFHPMKPLEKLYRYKGEGAAPEWFLQGVQAAQLAPTAMNQQKFCFHLEGNTVFLEAGTGFYSKIDQGIVRYHFELGAGHSDWRWANELLA